MARTKAVLGKEVQLANLISISYVALNSPLAKIREVLSSLGLASQRVRDLPAELTFFFTLALCLYRDVAYREVLELAIEGLRPTFGNSIGDVISSEAALSKARTRLGSRPFEEWYMQSVAPVGNEAKPGVMYCGYRVMAIDGSTLEIPDEKGNALHYGYPSSARGSSAYPLIRFVTLTECATNVMIGAQMGPYRTSEQELAKEVVKKADSSMLLLADRGLAGYPQWRAAGEQGCKRLFRIKNNQVMPVLKVLPDNSWISEIYPDQKARRAALKGVYVEGVEKVRVIEYFIDGENGKPQKYRLITDLLDEKSAPAKELAALYHRRWRIETSISELKVQLNESRVLRSKTPELVRQEFYAMLIVHAAIRKLISDAADTTSLAAEEISFIAAVRVVKRRLSSSASFSPSGA